MKKILLTSLLAAGFITSAIANETLTLDPTHSYVEYNISHFGKSIQSGKWFANGTVNLDQKNLDKSSVNVTIQVNTLTTGLDKLNEHLLSKDFFNAESFPTVTFASNKVVSAKDGKFVVDGMLTLHGVTKPVKLNVVSNGISINPMNKLNTAGYTATTTIKRSDYGISAYVPAVGDEVKLTIDVEAQDLTKPVTK